MAILESFYYTFKDYLVAATIRKIIDVIHTTCQTLPLSNKQAQMTYANCTVKS